MASTINSKQGLPNPEPIKGSKFVQRFFNQRVEDMFKLYAETGPVSHSGEKGAFRELLLRNVIASVLPPHFGLGTGLIVDSDGKQSRQTDIIIYDKRVLPPVAFQEGRGLFPFDAIHRTIEVKSTLKRPDLLNAETAARLMSPKNPSGLRIADQGILENGDANYPFAALFAFDAEFDIQEEDLPQEMRDPQLTMCRVVCVANKKFLYSDFVLANPCPSPEFSVRRFVVELLERLEESSASRSTFKVRNWLI
jgi:hypothetical protein